MIKAHVLTNDGTIANTIMVGGIDALPNLIDASIGGSIGDRIVDGLVVPAPAQPISAAEHNARIIAALAAIDAKTIRPLREGDTARVAALDAEAAALRAQLIKD